MVDASPTLRTWSGRAGPPGAVLLTATAAAALAAATTTALLMLAVDADPRPVPQGLLFVWIILSYTSAGLMAWWRRPQSRFGPLMVATGFAAFLATLSFATYEPVFTVGQLFDLILAPILLHVLLAFPTGRLAGPFERRLVVATYAAAIGLQLVRMVLGEPPTSFMVTDAPDAAMLAFRIQLVLVSGLALTGVGLIVVRRRAEGHSLRRPLALLIYSFSLSLVMIAFLLVTAVLGKYGFETIRRLTLFTIGLAPAAFLVGLLDARLTRSAAADLLIDLRARPAPADLRDSLSKALRDPSLSLVYWLPEFDSWADVDGRRVTLPENGRRRATMIEREGEPIAALLHDTALDDEPELLASVGAAAGLALENGQLHAELRARVEELEGSRARIIDATHSERKRLERDLHDGAQQRLIALSIELALIQRRLGSDPDIAARVDHARREVGTSIDELRDLAHGLRPALLAGRGLAASLESMAARSSVPVDLRIDLPERLPEPVEVAVYYVVSESLANVGKHAEASAVTVLVRRSLGGVLVEVVDDGVGGAALDAGSGLRGLADRVETLGGRFEVWAPDGGGSGVRAELPCG